MKLKTREKMFNRLFSDDRVRDIRLQSEDYDPHLLALHEQEHYHYVAFPLLISG